MSVTDKMKKLRAAKSAPVKPGQWHADFKTVKNFALKNEIPLLAVWSNGDSCGHCIAFEQCLMDSKFKNWAKTSGVAMWIGFGTDTSAEDKFEGAGFKFARKDTLKAYPFVRLYWREGKVDLCKSGGQLTGDTSKGAGKLVTALKNALKNYNPGKEDENPKPGECDNCQPQNPTNEDECDNCEFKIPVLAAEKAKDGTYSVTVDGKAATGLPEETAKFVVSAYDKGKNA